MKGQNMTRTLMIEKLDNELSTFFASIEKEFHLPENIIMQRWNDNADIKPTKKKDAKKSNYQVFFSIQRNIIMKNNPDMTFGEISKMISSLWKKISPTERATYTLECLQKEETNKKQQILDALVEKTKTDNESIKIIQSKRKTGRSKLELSVDDEKKEEEDFFFQEEIETDSHIDPDDEEDVPDMDDDIYDDED